MVYYRGNNDAWDGYGGAVVYTKEPAFPKEFIPEMREAVEKVRTPPRLHPPTPSPPSPHPPFAPSHHHNQQSTPRLDGPP